MTVQRASSRGEALKSHTLYPKIESPGIPIEFSLCVHPFIHPFMVVNLSWLYSVCAPHVFF